MIDTGNMSQDDRRADCLLGAFAFVVPLIVYFVTLAPSVAFWDAGEFIAAAWTLGVPHPPGTPLYVLFGRIASLVPIGDVAVRVNALSAVAAALSCLFLYLVLLRLMRIGDQPDALSPWPARGGALAGALLAMAGATFWTNATEAEVYALSNLVMVGTLWLLLRWDARRSMSEDVSDDRPLLLIGYVLSLSIAIHLGTYLVLPPFALFVLLRHGHVLRDVRIWLWVVLLSLLALSVHFFLPIRSHLDPVIDEANPESVQEFVDFILRKQYKPVNPFERQASWAFQFTMYWRYFFEQYGVWIHTLGLIGVCAHCKRNRSGFALYGSLFLIMSLFLIFYMNFTDSEVRDRDYFFAPSFFLWAGWVGWGGAWLLSRVRWLRNPVGALLLLAIPGMVTALGWEVHDRRGNYVARNYAYNMLQSLEPNALLFTNGDNDTFPLWYLQEVEGVRKDVRVMNLALLHTNWYIHQIKHTEPRVPIAFTDEEIEILRPFRDQAGEIIWVQEIAVFHIIRENDWERPVYFAVTVSDLLGLDTENRLSLEGLVFKLLPEPSAGGINPVKAEENLWNRYRYESILDDSGMLDASVYRTPHEQSLITNYAAGHGRLAIHYRKLAQYDDAVRNLARAGTISPRFRVYRRLMGPLLLEAGKLDEADAFYQNQVASWPDSVHAYIGLGYVRQAKGDSTGAEASYREAIRRDPSEEESFLRLFQLLASGERWDEAKSVLTEWSNAHPENADVRSELNQFDRVVENRKRVGTATPRDQN